MFYKGLDEGGMSSIVGVFLVTALTLILVALAGGLVIGAVNLQGTAPVSHFTVNDHNDEIDSVTANNLAIITHMGGDAINCSCLRLVILDSELTELDTLEFKPETKRYEGSKFLTDFSIGNDRFEVGDVILLKEKSVDEVSNGEIIGIRFIDKLTYQIIFEDTVVLD